MNKPVQMVLVLGLVALLSGASLVLVYRYATPLIDENQRTALKEAIFDVVPGAVRYEAVRKEGEEYFEVYDASGTLIGYAFMAEGNGYQGRIKMIAAVKRDLSTFYGIEILESVETPGLGGEITSDDFKGQFEGLRFTPEIVCVKTGAGAPNEIDAITGATISSKSVTSILNAELEKLIDILK